MNDSTKRKKDADGEEATGTKAKKGSGKGKGKRRQQTEDAPSPITSVEEAINAHNRLLLRMDTEQRMLRRDKQFLLTIQPECTALRKCLSGARERWNSTRPKQGSHPIGEIHSFLWAALIDHITRDPAPCVPRDAGVFLQRTCIVRDDHVSSRLCMFFPLGRLTDNNVWRYVIRFSDSTAEGRQDHESMCELVEGGDLNVTIQKHGFKFEHDKAPVDQLVRFLRNLSL
jgi:hypothetical protein